MIGPAFTVRNYRPSDFDDYVNFISEVERLQPSGHCTSSQIISEHLNRPGYTAEKNLFLAQAGGKIIGFMNVTPEHNRRRVILDCLVHPEHRRRGVAGGELFRHAMRRAGELKAGAVRASIRQENKAGRKMLLRLGFKNIRRYLKLELPLAEAHPAKASSGTCLRRHLRRGEEAKLARLQNRCFSDAWEYNPNTTEDIAYALSLGHASPEDVILFYKGGTPVGYCWTKIGCDTGADNDGGKGSIFMLGVDPDHRSSGIGRLALLSGLAYLKNRGVRTAELEVDSQNKAALNLYRSIGFKERSTILWYEKTLD